MTVGGAVIFRKYRIEYTYVKQIFSKMFQKKIKSNMYSIASAVFEIQYI